MCHERGRISFNRGVLRFVLKIGPKIQLPCSLTPRFIPKFTNYHFISVLTQWSLIWLVPQKCCLFQFGFSGFMSLIFYREVEGEQQLQLGSGPELHTCSWRTAVLLKLITGCFFVSYDPEGSRDSSEINY